MMSLKYFAKTPFKDKLFTAFLRCVRILEVNLDRRPEDMSSLKEFLTFSNRFQTFLAVERIIPSFTKKIRLIYNKWACPSS